MPARPWHTIDVEEAAAWFGVDLERGLNEGQAAIRLKEYGYNCIRERRKTPAWSIFIQQFKDFMVLVLLGATFLSFFMGEFADAATILAIVVLNAILGFIQENRAERSLDAIKRLASPTARVLREGEDKKKAASELVPGDIILLETGDRVPADALLLEAVALEAEESPLTGESQPVKKRPGRIQDKNTPLGDRYNMVFMGTMITRGRGKGLVVASGMDTEMGAIAGMIQEVGNDTTPLQKRLNQLGKYLVDACLLVVALVVVTGVYRGEPMQRMFMAGVSLAVAAIPEGLPAIVTIGLALGVQRMARLNAVVRRLPAVETLGSATVICTDKTGTLTKNEMTVKSIYTADGVYQVTGEGYRPSGRFLASGTGVNPVHEPVLFLGLKIAALCNNSTLVRGSNCSRGWLRRAGRLVRSDPNPWAIRGDPTEGALVVCARKAGLTDDVLEAEYRRVAEIPFDSDRKRMTVIVRDNQQQYLALVKGAPDVILGLCSGRYVKGRVQALGEEHRREILAANEEMATQAMRVLAVAYRHLPHRPSEEELERVEQNLTFVGLFGMMDPPRPEAKEAVSLCRRAGIRVVMVTGDHVLTALAVGRLLGFEETERAVVSGPELDLMSDQELARRVDGIGIYARVSPNHKLRIVRALKKKGHVVAMTGDGVNDAPALKEADIGVAMGRTGTDVSREAAAMVLTDDNFATLVAAIREGRAIYDNIRKFIRYLLSGNVGEVFTMFLATLAGLPLPLLPIQILWVNLVTDGLPAMALGVDPPEPGIMSRPPRAPEESIFAGRLGMKILGRGTLISLGTLAVFCVGLYLGRDLVLARTMAFATLVLSQLFHSFECRGKRAAYWFCEPFRNPHLLGAVALSTVMLLVVTHVPFLQGIFNTTPLGVGEWVMILLASGGGSILVNTWRLLPGTRWW